MSNEHGSIVIYIPYVSLTTQGIFYLIVTVGRSSLHYFGTILSLALLLACFEVCCGNRIPGMYRSQG